MHDPRAPVVVFVLLLFASACILPPSLSTGTEDAGVNSPPAIIAVRADAGDVFEPGPITLTRNSSGTINFELLDTDLQDPLLVRVFVGYTIDDPKPARAQCAAPTTGQARRSVSCTASAICQAADVGKSKLELTAVVFDRAPADQGKPEFQALPEGGLSTSRFFFLTCAEMP